MTLLQHVMDTIKEWQMKIGTDDAGIRLYYPKQSLCGYLHLNTDTDNAAVCKQAKQYLEEQAPFLGEVTVTEHAGRFCIYVGQAGCAYIDKNVMVPEFLKGFLEAIATKDMHRVRTYFEQYAKAHGTCVHEQLDEEDLGVVFSFADKQVEPYYYCVNDDQFGITYHRFSKDDFDMI